MTAAPWSKLSNGMVDWARAARQEYEFQRKLVKQTNRGLTLKDRAKIEDQMKQWYREEAKAKARRAIEEKEEIQRDIEAIHVGCCCGLCPA